MEFFFNKPAADKIIGHSEAANQNQVRDMTTLLALTARDEEDAIVARAIDIILQRLNSIVEKQQEVIEQLNRKIEADRPYVNYGRVIAPDPNAQDIKQFAKSINSHSIKSNVMHLILRKLKVLTKNKLPYSYY